MVTSKSARNMSIRLFAEDASTNRNDKSYRKNERNLSSFSCKIQVVRGYYKPCEVYKNKGIETRENFGKHSILQSRFQPLHTSTMQSYQVEVEHRFPSTSFPFSPPLFRRGTVVHDVFRNFFILTFRAIWSLTFKRLLRLGVRERETGNVQCRDSSSFFRNDTLKVT